TCGLSNISFGMPEREKINGAFLTMALARGMNLAIANVGSEYLMTALAASGALTGGMNGIKRYIDKFSAVTAPKAAEVAQMPPEKLVYNGVLCGDAELTAKSIVAALAAGISAKSLVDDYLIKAINQVGELYDKKKYFLPQLMQSAEAMSAGFNYLEPILRENSASTAQKPKVVIATVQGDIHDIGKNIAGLMLKNYGFEVIDLGKDVPAKQILDALRTYNAKILGLSALMTTTMIRLPEVIDLVRSAGLGEVKIMVAGAVVDQAYADLIGADGYAADAMAGVVLAKRFAEID
ncbi:MAG: cobalamin-dependent protein, partial [Victivallaceae bacterium]